MTSWSMIITMATKQHHNNLFTVKMESDSLSSIDLDLPTNNPNPPRSDVSFSDQLNGVWNRSLSLESLNGGELQLENLESGLPTNDIPSELPAPSSPLSSPPPNTLSPVFDEAVVSQVSTTIREKLFQKVQAIRDTDDVSLSINTSSTSSLSSDSSVSDITSMKCPFHLSPIILYYRYQCSF